MPSKEKKKKKKRKLPRPNVNVAQLYNEDIGYEGLKQKRVSSASEISFQLPIDEQEESKRLKRMQRFVEHNGKQCLPKNSILKGSQNEFSSRRSNTVDSVRKNTKLVGTSTALEKSYMRLTAAPRAQDVRPLKVLRKALAHVKAHFIENEDFNFANEQLKSIRQDITVQHLRNTFVLEVYETHARMLLEHGDLNEFNQCQTMIRTLTSFTDPDVFASKKSMRSKASKHDVLSQSEETADEFRAYSLLYDVVQNSWCDLMIHLASEKSSFDISNEFRGPTTITNATIKVPITQGLSVRHALKVIKAIIHDDYLSFFRLYESAPHMSAYLMDFLVRRVRDVGYVRIIAAYRPTISTERFREVLSFHDMEETKRFLGKKGAVFLKDNDNPPFWIDCKATYSSYLNSIN